MARGRARSAGQRRAAALAPAGAASARERGLARLARRGARRLASGTEIGDVERCLLYRAPAALDAVGTAVRPRAHDARQARAAEMKRDAVLDGESGEHPVTNEAMVLGAPVVLGVVVDAVGVGQK